MVIINKTDVATNPVIDTIAAAREHYKKYNRYIETVILDKVRWGIFKLYMQRKLDGQDVEIRDELQYRDMSVKWGGPLAVKPYEFILKASTLDQPKEIKPLTVTHGNK